MNGLRAFAALLLIVAALCGGRAAAQTIEGLEGAAAKAIEAEIRRSDFGDFVVAEVFYGDLTGQGTQDALSLVRYSTGGNSMSLTTWIWRDTDVGYLLARVVPIEEFFGIEPRDVRFSPGRIEVTTTVLNPDDPRCCPTGEKTFVLSSENTAPAAPAVESQAPAGPAGRLDVAIHEQGGDGQMASCASSRVSGLKQGGYLTVRSGPGTTYRKLDELRNGETVYVFEMQGPWAGIVYRTQGVSCAATQTRPVPHDNTGWVHTDWLSDLAG
jgi:hypothetical protein